MCPFSIDLSLSILSLFHSFVYFHISSPLFHPSRSPCSFYCPEAPAATTTIPVFSSWKPFDKINIPRSIEMSACLERRSLFGGFNFENYRDYDRQGQFLKGLVEGSPRGDWRKFAGSMNDRICLQGLRAARERLERKEGSSFLRYL